MKDPPVNNESDGLWMIVSIILILVVIIAVILALDIHETQINIPPTTLEELDE